MSPAASIQDISLLRDQASTAKRLLRKRHLSLESQNEAAKLHLAASLRMGDWLRNCHEKAVSPGWNQHSGRSQNGTDQETYSSLGIDKRGSLWMNPQPRIIGASVFDSFFDSIGRFDGCICNHE